MADQPTPLHRGSPANATSISPSSSPIFAPASATTIRERVMRNIASRLSDTDITALAAFLSQTPELHEAVP